MISVMSPALRDVSDCATGVEREDESHGRFVSAYVCWPIVLCHSVAGHVIMYL